MNVLTGFDLPTAGRVELGGATSRAGRRSGAAAPGSRARSSTGRCSAALTVRENVEVAALGVGASPREARRARRRLLGAARARARAPTSAAAALPHGDERKLGVARALATEPRFVLMDEPAAGLHEAEVPAFAAVVRSVRDEFGAGVLLIDHNVTLIMDVCDRIHVLDQGRTLAEGTPDEIRAEHRRRERVSRRGSGRDV